ncbi:hypothetical protein DPX39_080056600 [Trypanosoma brucei equiperdum]|uniref:Coiled-coil domain-containing protein 39 n=2 Tax=Trypanosoma brucei TaxID=5691 RepID=A0A3L6L2L4_9TRYP|nr:hypothetical protein DPX39_080056600 [Trypanosoma brucei equiperdum]
MNLEVVDATAEALPLELLNAVNKELTAQLSRHEEIHDGHVREVQDQRRRLEFVKEHLGNVRGEIVNTQALADSKKREMESELHMYRLLLRECGRLKQRQTQMQAEQADVQERLQVVQDRLFTENLRMAELKNSMAYNQEALEQWDAARQQKESDEAAVARYAKDDAVKLRQLDNAVERHEAQLRERRRQLQDEVAVMYSVQLELNRVATDYRRQHKERGDLINEWERVVKEIRERDNSIRAAAQQYAEGAEWIEQRRVALKKLHDDYDAARAEEALMQAGIEEREHRAEKSRQTRSSLETHVTGLENEVETIREELGRSIKERNNARIRLEQSKVAVRDKTAAHQRLTAKRDDLKEQKSSVYSKGADLSTQLATIGRLFKEAQDAEKQMDKETEMLKKENFTMSERLKEVRREQSDLLAEISGGQLQAQNLRTKIGQLDGQYFAQQQVLYGVEFSVQQMQRKVNRAKGERSLDERNKLHEKIAALQNTLNDLTKQQRAMETQVKRVREETWHANVELERLTSEKKVAGEKLLQLSLGCDSCTAELTKLRKQHEEKLVLVDTQELQLQDLKRTLHQRNGELGTLAERKRQLTCDIAERLSEIAVHHDMMKMEAKLVEEQRRRLVSDLRERQKALVGLRNRYDVQLVRLDPEKANWTPAQVVMEAAREREDLQLRGDTLDARVSRMEREMAKLKRTLDVIRASNSNYRHMFDPVPESHDMVKMRIALQQQQRDLKAAVSRRVMELNDYQQVMESKEQDLRQTLEKKERARATVENLQQACEQVHEGIMQARETVIRYTQTIQKASANVAPEVVADVELQENREMFNNALGRLLQLAQQHGDEVRHHVQTLLASRFVVE